jgi:hypothetical protein
VEPVERPGVGEDGEGGGGLATSLSEPSVLLLLLLPRLLVWDVICMHVQKQHHGHRVTLMVWDVICMTA